MYILLYVNTSNQPCYFQGSIEEINVHVRNQWGRGLINSEHWEAYAPFELLCIDDGALTPVNSWEMTNIPQFIVT